MKNEKLLVGIINSFTKKQMFFGLWIFIVSFFTYLMYRFYKQSTQRNFKEPRDYQLRKGTSLTVPKKESEKSVSQKKDP